MKVSIEKRMKEARLIENTIWHPGIDNSEKNIQLWNFMQSLESITTEYLQGLEIGEVNNNNYTCTCDPDRAKNEKDNYTYSRQTILQLPAWSIERKHRLQQDRAPTVCVDSCIVEAIEQLWDRGIETTGCCCGHNIERAWVSVHPDDYIPMFELGYEQKPVELINDIVMGVYTFYL